LWIFLVRFAFYGELLFLLQPKQSNQKKAATTATPRKKHGVPMNSVLLSCCEKTRKQRSDSFHRKPMITKPNSWLAKVEDEAKKNKTSKAVLTVKVVF